MSRTARLTGKHTNYNLYRTRVWRPVVRGCRPTLWRIPLWRHHRARLPPLPRDVNRGDILNFTDVKLAEPNGNPLYLRFGQQELLFGSQRLLSTNDWGNNRHRFQAVKTFYRSKQWDADLFTGRPVQVRFNDLDPGDHDQWFTGAWLTYKPRAGTFFDLYYPNLDNTTPGVARALPHRQVQPQHYRRPRHRPRRLRLPVGRRGAAVQFGGWADQSILAEMFTTYIGWNFKNARSTPRCGWVTTSPAATRTRTRPARDGPSINFLRSVTTISGSWTTWDDRTSTTSPCRRTAIR